jgi:hypothetical protein
MELWQIVCIEYNCNLSAFVGFIMLIVTYVCVSKCYPLIKQEKLATFSQYILHVRASFWIPPCHHHTMMQAVEMCECLI